MTEGTTVRWVPGPPIYIGDEVKKDVEEQIARIDLDKVRALGEYDETGEGLVLQYPDPLDGLFVKVAKRRGKIIVLAGQWEHGGFVEEYCVGEVVVGKTSKPDVSRRPPARTIS